MSGPGGPVFSDELMTLAPGGEVDIPAIRKRIVDLIHGEFDELKPYARAEPVQLIVPPAVMAYPIDRVTYDETFDAAATFVMPVRIYLKQNEDATDQDALDAYLAPRGPKSIPAFMRTQPTLGGLVEDARIVEARNYGIWPIANVSFLGFEFIFEIRV